MENYIIGGIILLGVIYAAYRTLFSKNNCCGNCSDCKGCNSSHDENEESCCSSDSNSCQCHKND
ncbi:MAG: FeoB-associated Cys-rich membrane protein [Akkermansia sp.]|nr:FeoB-associated Cys-rich membrane protein [Akkermansia sp.]